MFHLLKHCLSLRVLWQDEDDSGLVDLQEFKILVGFVIYFNQMRHSIEELRTQFTEDLDVSPAA